METVNDSGVNLTDAQKRTLFSDFGVGKETIKYNPAAVKQRLEGMRRRADN